MSLWTSFTRGHRPLWVERALLGTLLVMVPGGLPALLWLAARWLNQHRAAGRTEHLFPCGADGKV